MLHFALIVTFCGVTHVGAHPDGHQHGGPKPTETSVTEFCYKSVKLSLEQLKNRDIKIVLFLIQERTVQIAKFPEISLLFPISPMLLSRDFPIKMSGSRFESARTPN